MTTHQQPDGPDPNAPPSAASLARAADDLALAGSHLAAVLRASDLTPEAAHRAERAILDAREGVARAYLNAGVRS